MYKCKPERNTKQVFFLLVASIAVTIGIFFLATIWQQNAGIIRFIGYFFVALCIYVIYRFTMTEMEYTLDNGNFIITKIVGAKRTEQGSLDLTYTVALVTKEEYIAQKLNQNISTTFNYSQNIGGKHWVYVFEFNGKRSSIEFEPNDEFIAIFKDEIENAKNRPQSPDDGSGNSLLI